MTKFDRTSIKKGMLMHGAPCRGDFVAGRSRHDDSTRLAREYPGFEEAIKTADAAATMEKINRLAEERRQLADRLNLMRATVAKLKGRK